MAAFLSTFIVLLLFVLLLCIYFWPYFIASKKQEEEHLAIFVINLFVGWTIIGWFICLMWAISLNDYRTPEQKAESSKNVIWTFVLKYWIAILSVIFIISVFAGIGDSISSNNTSNNNFNTEAIRKETKNYTVCGLGDLLGDDVETLNYKGYNISYHKSDFSKGQIKKFTDDCLNEGATSQYQIDCCVGYRMYPY